MMQDIKEGNIDCVIVKDLSRLGRNYVEAGSYIERVFPFFNVRFISVNDHYDSFRDDISLLISMSNVYNEFYSRDLAKKIRSSYRTSWANGEFPSGQMAYGYEKDNRVIPMTDEVYEILQNQKIKQTEQKMWKRSIWKQHKEFQNLVFTCSDGSPVYYYNVNSAIKDYVAKINVIEIELAKEEKREPKILELFTCHTLRHTYATRCYENGVDQQVVQKLLGHSTLAMTTDLYTHVSEEKKKEEVAELKILA